MITAGRTPPLTAAYASGQFFSDLNAKTRDASNGVSYGYGFPTKAKPSSNVVHRITYTEDGDIRTPTLHVTRAEFARHAERYETEAAEETARSFLDDGALGRLRVDLDVIEREKRSSAGYSIGKRRRRSSEETAAAVIQLSAEGLLPAAIADKLAISDKRVQAFLRAA
jgi:hypothetical protein